MNHVGTQRFWKKLVVSLSPSAVCASWFHWKKGEAKQAIFFLFDWTKLMAHDRFFGDGKKVRLKNIKESRFEKISPIPEPDNLKISRIFSKLSRAQIIDGTICQRLSECAKIGPILKFSELSQVNPKIIFARWNRWKTTTQVIFIHEEIHNLIDWPWLVFLEKPEKLHLH